MKPIQGQELPPELEEAHQRGVKLAWITIGYLLTAITLLYFVRGNSQALKTAWLDDMLALVPPAVFLLSSRFRTKSPDARHPYGFHRAPSIAFLASAITLLVMGLYLMFEAARTLVAAEHPSIGTLEIVGTTIWIGFPAAAVMLYKICVGYPLGRAKLEPARATHNKVLYADATMTRDDSHTALAAAVGVLLVGAGFWWADSAAALLISISIARDGVKNIEVALGDLMDRMPLTVNGDPDDAVERIRRELERSPLVRRAAVRLRENGQVFIGEALILPMGRTPTAEECSTLSQAAKELDWRIQELVIAPVPSLEDVRDEAECAPSAADDG